LQKVYAVRVGVAESYGTNPSDALRPKVRGENHLPHIKRPVIYASSVDKDILFGGTSNKGRIPLSHIHKGHLHGIGWDYPLE
jgi:hypothetical protein